MENEQYIESGLSVGAVKYVDPNEIITEEEYNYIKNKVPELNGRVGNIEDEIDTINNEIEEINSSLDNNTKELLYTDNIKRNEIMSKWHKLVKEAKEGIRDDVVYICVGDSTRESNGQHIFKTIQNVLEPCNVKCYLHAQSGLKAEHWSETNLVQPGYIKVSNLWGANAYTWDVIPNDGSTTMIDICLGINDMTGDKTETDVYNYIKAGIDKIKSVKPNVLINITSCNRLNANEKTNKLNNVYKKLIADNNYSFIDVLNKVFQTWYDLENMLLDGTHPSEIGQLRMADYILSKLIPKEVAFTEKNVLPISFPVVIESSSNADIINNSIEYIITDLNVPRLYIGKFSTGKFYFFTGENSSVSVGFNITSHNRGILNVYGNGFYRIYSNSPSESNGLTSTHTFLMKVKDATLLNTLPNSTMVEINYKSLNNDISFKPIYKQLADNNDITLLKGTLDKNDSNYDDIKSCGFSCEIIQTGGTPINDFYIRKASGKWYIMKDINGNGVIEFKPTKGIQNLTNVHWATETLTARVEILEPTVLDSWDDSIVRYIKIVDCKVTYFSSEINLIDYIKKINLGLI